MKTAVERYISVLKNYREINGTIDDAIVIAETLLLEIETAQRRKDFEAGGKSGFNAASGKDVLTFEEYIKLAE